MGRNGAVMEFSKYASDAMSLSRDRCVAPKHKFTIYTYMPTYIWRFPIMGVPQSHPSHKTILELKPMVTWGSFMLRLAPIDIGQSVDCLEGRCSHPIIYLWGLAQIGK